MVKLFFHGFWPGFYDRTDANKIDFFVKWFRCDEIDPSTRSPLVQIVNSPYAADVLIETWFAPSIVWMGHWTKKIFVSWEGRVPPGYPHRNQDDYDLFLEPQSFILPTTCFQSYVWCNPLVTQRIDDSSLNESRKRFCCAIISNGEDCERVRFLNRLDQRSNNRVTYLGKWKNSSNELNGINYWDKDYLKVINGFKFIVCFENRQVDGCFTEKLANAFASGSIPVYFGSKILANRYYTNAEKGMIIINDQSEYDQVIDRMLFMDSDESIYRSFVDQSREFTHFNRPTFLQDIQLLRGHMSQFLALPETHPLIFVPHWSPLTQRKKHIESLFQRYKIDAYEFITDYDAESIDPKLIDEKFDSLKVKLGEISLFLKHIQICKTIIKYNLPRAIAFEDDVSFVFDPNQIDFWSVYDSIIGKLLNNLAQEGKPQPDFIFMGDGCKLHAPVSTTGTGSFQFVPTKQSRCTDSFVISQNGAKALVKFYENYSTFNQNSTKIDKPIDHFMNFVFTHPSTIDQLLIVWMEPTIATQLSQHSQFSRDQSMQFGSTLNPQHQW